MKIVVVDGATLSSSDNPWTALFDLGDVEIHERSSPEEIVTRGRGAQVLITNKARITADMMARLPELRFIAVSATGHDCVDTAAARRRGILVANVPVYGTDSVAQFVFALLLELCHHVGLHSGLVHAGEWQQSPEFCFWRTPLVELAGKKMGIIGFGKIGRRVGELAHAFGMEVLACSRSQTSPPAYTPFSWTDRDELARNADVITLHCPLTEETRSLVNRRFLERVSPAAFLINTARGSLVVEQDLADALNSDRLAGAAVDVVSAEPIAATNPLLTAKNCLLTPHIAWATLAARKRLLNATVANVAAFLAGRPTNVVN